MTVGETLSHARRTRGLSVDDVAAQTRIRSTVIRGIEADDFRLCGGAVYARGHIRSIAKVLGVDAVPLVAEFDAAHQPDPLVERVPVAAVVAPQPTDPDVVSRSERHRPNWTAAMATALAVVCVIAIAAFIANRGGGGNKGQHANKPPAVSTQQTTPPPSVTPSTQPPVQQAADRATMLVRTIHGRTWLSITSKTGTLLFEGILAPGEQKKFTNRHGLTFVIGNAPAVDVVVNGHDIGEPPSSGNVSRGDVSPGADNVQQA
ncbi:MAG TPA: RodZ domain-containing protein [Mycobacteriales bacterium]|nr:RodZ domain-containing protein [Mycobacteriales bacterium]